MEQMISMTQNRARYNDQMFLNHNPYPYQSHPNHYYPQSGLDDYDAEKYRNKILERQITDMAREHAREKQGLVAKLEELRFGNGRIRTDDLYNLRGARSDY